MKAIRIEHIINCPVCGSPVTLLKNASKDFQVRCMQCGARSGWKRKTDAVIQWYNMVIQYTRSKEKGA